MAYGLQAAAARLLLLLPPLPLRPPFWALAAAPRRWALGAGQRQGPWARCYGHPTTLRTPEAALPALKKRPFMRF